MLFHKSDRENIHKILANVEGSQQNIISMRVRDMSEIMKAIDMLTMLTNTMLNEFDLLKSRMIALENKIIPKLATPPTSIKTSKKK